MRSGAFNVGLRKPTVILSKIHPSLTDLTYFSPTYLTHKHTHTTYYHTHYLLLTHSPTLAPISSHTFTHISPTYHSNIHRCQPQLPITHSPHTTQTHTHVSPTYHSHIHHLPLTHSPTSAPLTYHTSMSVPLISHTLTTYRSPLPTHRSPLPTHRSPLPAHHFPLTTHHIPLPSHFYLQFTFLASTDLYVTLARGCQLNSLKPRQQ